MKFRFKLVFFIGAFLLIMVSLLAGWSLVKLRAEIDLRRTYSALQVKLDDLLYSLQEADNSLLAYKLTENQEEYTSFQLNLTQAQREINDLVSLSEKSPEVQKGIRLLKYIMDEKIKITQSPEFQKNLSQSLRNKNFFAIRDDLLLTDAIRDRTSDIYEVFSNKYREHQGFVDQYFDFNLVTFVVIMLFSFSFFLAFAFQVSREISRRELLESELRQAQLSAVNASQMKSQFLATVSHEIRTPLNGIIGMSDLIRARIHGQELKKFADTIYSSAQTLLRIVNDILDFSKIEANKLVFELQEVQISQVLESVGELLGRLANEKKLEFYINYDPNLMGYFITDGERISQVVHNLIGNAIKFTSRGFIQINAHLISERDQSYFLFVEVSDSGQGIAQEDHEMIFQPFHRSVGETDHEGTGLGLSISKRIVEGLNGQIGFESRLNVGSRFWFRVPVTISKTAEKRSSELSNRRFFSYKISEKTHHFFQNFAEVHHLSYLGRIGSLLDVEQEAVLVDEAQFAILSLNSQLEQKFLERMKVFSFPLTPLKVLTILTKSDFQAISIAIPETLLVKVDARQDRGHILLVEDHPTNQLLTKTQLDSLGLQTTVVDSGKDCIELLKQQHFDLILMDCRMSHMDGFECTRIIRRMELQSKVRRTPIIALTANAIAGDREKCLAAGMEDYLSKPVDIYQLRTVLFHWLNQKTNLIDEGTISQLKEKTSAHVVAKMLLSFDKSLATAIIQIQQKFSNKEYAEVENLIHQIKPSAIALGAKMLGELCAQIESEFQSTTQINPSSIENWVRLSQQVKVELQAMIAQVRV